MPRYHTTFKPQSIQYNSTPIFGIGTGATAYAILRMLEIEVDATSGTTNISYGLGAPSALGKVLPSGILLIGEDAASPPNITIATNWSAPPTIPSAFFRRFTIASGNNNAGARLIFPEGLKIGANSALSLWAIAGANQILPQQITVCLEIDG